MQQAWQSPHMMRARDRGDTRREQSRGPSPSWKQSLVARHLLGSAGGAMRLRMLKLGRTAGEQFVPAPSRKVREPSPKDE